MRRKDEQAGCVYVFEARTRYVKIGKSTRPEKRIMGIASQSGIGNYRQWISEMRYDYGALEMELHRRFRECRATGEYFFASFEEVLGSAVSLCKEWDDKSYGLKHEKLGYKDYMDLALESGLYGALHRCAYRQALEEATNFVMETEGLDHDSQGFDYYYYPLTNYAKGILPAVIDKYVEFIKADYATRKLALQQFVSDWRQPRLVVDNSKSVSR